ncbi:MAG: methyltransferase domain-containing protein [Gammaproteobacteria bacterium]|nr:methyltransferase domain-containing protein [Gammaproteobacteria bacterium]
MARRRKRPPELRLAHVDGLDRKGNATLDVDGRTRAAHGGLPGERVVVALPSGRRPRPGRVARVLVPVPDRVVPRCPHYVTCGGCSLMHQAPAAQLAHKQARLLATLAERDVVPERALAPLAGPAWHYRRRARLGAREVDAKGRVLVGFRERGGSFVADMATCHVLVAPVARLVGPLGELIGGLSISRRVPQVEVAAGDDAVLLVLRTLDPPSGTDLDRLRDFERRHGVALCLQPGDASSVVTLGGGAPPDLSYALPEFDVAFAFGPNDFVQVNGPLNRRLVGRAVDLLGPRPDETVLDLFCGLGNFSLPLARRAGRVIGLEGSAALVARAGRNAAANGIANATFAVRDLYGRDPGPLVPPGTGVDRVLIDPPRTGAGPALAQVAALAPRRIAYVSCNPATLAEDAAELVQRYGYRPVAAGAVDMFPHTAHAEALALFEA